MKHAIDALEADDVRHERKNHTECEPLDDAFEDELDIAFDDFSGDFY